MVVVVALPEHQEPVYLAAVPVGSMAAAEVLPWEEPFLFKMMER